MLTKQLRELENIPPVNEKTTKQRRQKLSVPAQLLEDPSANYQSISRTRKKHKKKIVTVIAIG